MLHKDQGMVGLVQDSHELEDCESPADLQGLESAVQPTHDGGSRRSRKGRETAVGSGCGSGPG